MNHQEAKDILLKLLPEEETSLIKIEVFRLSWLGKGYNIIAEESGYDHDYVRKAGSQLWKVLSKTLETDVTKRNFRPLIEAEISQSSTRPHPLEFPGSILSFSSPFYIQRSREEEQAYLEITKPGSLLRIKGPGKMGKSSLLTRVLDQAETEGFSTVMIDFKKADSRFFDSLDDLLKWVCYQMSIELGLTPRLDDYWNPLIGSKLSCSQYIEEYILSEVEQPVLLVFNEIDLTFEHEELCKDFLPLLRSLYEESKHNPTLTKLRQLLVYSTEIYVQLDLNSSPFNIGLSINLPALTTEQIAQLATRYGFNWKDDGISTSPVSILKQETGGHPYLIQLALYSIASKDGFIESPQSELASTLEHSTEPGGIFFDFCNQLLERLKASEVALSGFKKVTENEDITAHEQAMLESLGLITIKNNTIKPFNQLAVRFLSANI